MIEIIAQNRNGIPYPASDTDKEAIAEHYKQNQLMRLKTYKISKDLEPSVEQNNLFHACMGVVADNHPQMNTKEQVKFRLKVALNFIHEDRIAVRPDGMVQFEYRSFSFTELRNMERLNIFERGFETMAAWLGITVEELVAEAKSRMRSF